MRLPFEGKPSGTEPFWAPYLHTYPYSMAHTQPPHSGSAACVKETNEVAAAVQVLLLRAADGASVSFGLLLNTAQRGGGPPLWRQTPQLGGFHCGLSLDKAIPKRTVPSKRRPQIHCCLKVPGVVSVPTEHSLVVDNTTLPGSWKSTNHKTISSNQPWSTFNPRIQDVRTVLFHQSGRTCRRWPPKPGKILKAPEGKPGSFGG